ncbi:MAG: translocation/assembly module TamB domain-containing protein, partial [Candidatus Sulfotelmatobacter sp.]
LFRTIDGSAMLNATGTLADPVITGRTDLTSGELFYRNVRYQLQRGIITFNDPNETNPTLDVSVSTTIEQYNLTLNLRGPFDKLTTSYTSDPPLATADIINLIARGHTSSELAAQSQSTDSMIASQAASQISGSVQKLVGISALQVDPVFGGSTQTSTRVGIQQRVSKNFLFTFSTDLSQPGQEIVEGDYQINKRWSVSVERDQVGGVSVDGRLHTRF